MCNCFKAFSFRERSPRPGVLPPDPAGGSAPDPRYRLAPRALHVAANASKLSSSGGTSPPWPGDLPLDPAGAMPQTPVIGSRSALAMSPSLCPPWKNFHGRPWWWLSKYYTQSNSFTYYVSSTCTKSLASGSSPHSPLGSLQRSTGPPAGSRGWASRWKIVRHILVTLTSSCHENVVLVWFSIQRQNLASAINHKSSYFSVNSW